MNLLNRSLTLGLICLCACTTQEKKTFTINGTITGEVPEYLHVTYENSKDSVRVKNNKFQLRGTLENEVAPIYFSMVGGSTMMDDAYIENKDLEMEVNILKKKINDEDINFVFVNALNGTRTGEELKKLEDFKKLFNNETWYDDYADMLASFLKENPKHPVNFELLLNNYRQNYIKRFQYESLIGLLDTTFVSKQRIDFLRNHSDAKRKLNKGDRMYDFKLLSYNNELISTKNYRGNWLYVDFWSSSCVHCRVKKSALLEVYNDYKNEGLKLISVSLDTDENTWRKIIEEDDLSWENVLDKSGYDGSVAKHYSLIGVPTGILVNPYGEIEHINTFSNTEVLRNHLENAFLK